MNSLSPLFGDPTPIGFFIAIAYLIAAAACYKASTIDRRSVKIWQLLAIAMIMLGFNKQLDLQTSLTNVARAVFKVEGWYEARRQTQFWFIIGITLAALATSALAIKSVLGRRVEVKTAIVGTIVLLGFVVIRASSFHHVDFFLTSTAFGVAWNTVFELSGIALIASSAFLIFLNRSHR